MPGPLWGVKADMAPALLGIPGWAQIRVFFRKLHETFQLLLHLLQNAHAHTRTPQAGKVMKHHERRMWSGMGGS